MHAGGSATAHALNACIHQVSGIRNSHGNGFRRSVTVFFREGQAVCTWQWGTPSTNEERWMIAKIPPGEPEQTRRVPRSAPGSCHCHRRAARLQPQSGCDVSRDATRLGSCFVVPPALRGTMSLSTVCLYISLYRNYIRVDESLLKAPQIRSLRVLYRGYDEVVATNHRQ